MDNKKPDPAGRSLTISRNVWSIRQLWKAAQWPANKTTPLPMHNNRQKHVVAATTTAAVEEAATAAIPLRQRPKEVNTATPIRTNTPTHAPVGHNEVGSTVTTKKPVVSQTATASTQTQPKDTDSIQVSRSAAHSWLKRYKKLKKNHPLWNTKQTERPWSERSFIPHLLPTKLASTPTSKQPKVKKASKKTKYTDCFLCQEKAEVIGHNTVTCPNNKCKWCGKTQHDTRICRDRHRAHFNAIFSAPPYNNKLGPHRQDKGKKRKRVNLLLRAKLDDNGNRIPLVIPSSPVAQEDTEDVPLVNLEDVSSDELSDVDETKVGVEPPKDSLVILEDITSDELTISDKEEEDIMVISIKKRRHSHKPKKKTKD